MAIYHLSVKIISRGKGQSAIASAAYRSGKRLYDKRYDEVKDFSNKRGIVYSDIQLPPEAPLEYLDREILWNAVERAEKKSNARLSREIEVALPKELSIPQQRLLLHDYIQENFVSEGMCADWSIHDKQPNISGMNLWKDFLLHYSKATRTIQDPRQFFLIPARDPAGRGTGGLHHPTAAPAGQPGV